MVAAEAKASGLPLIVPDRGGAADHATGLRDHRYQAANGQALRDTILAVAADRRPAEIWQRPRLMDEHFVDLFAHYEALRTPTEKIAA